MSISRIPDLNSFKKVGRQGRERRDVTDRLVSKDEIIQSTDSDAMTSRRSAVNAGYMEDPFADLLAVTEYQKRLPLMNKGTYARTTGIDQVVEAFLSSCTGRKQIISLGAGSDTRFFRLKRHNSNLDLLYHEIDFAANTKTKISRLQANAEAIKALCGVQINTVTTPEDEYRSVDYYIHARDLRTMTEVPGLDEKLPTLLISECCLIYLSPEDAESVLKHLTRPFTKVAVVIYEPIRPFDAFGKTMIRNLVARGIHLQTMEKYSDIDHQCKRLEGHGFEARSTDIDLIWRKWISDGERERVDSLEWMDEIEEFFLLARHYCISWGWKGFENDADFKMLPWK